MADHTPPSSSYEPVPDKPGKKVVSGLLWSSVQNGSTRIITLVVLAFIQVFSEQGLTGAIFQRREIGRPLLNAASLIDFALSALIVVALFFAMPLIAVHFEMPELGDVLRWLSLVVLLGAFAFSQRAMQRRNFNDQTSAAQGLLERHERSCSCFG